MSDNDFYIEPEIEAEQPSRAEQQRYEDEQRYAQAQAQRAQLQNAQSSTTLDEDRISAIAKNAFRTAQQELKGEELVSNYRKNYPAFEAHEPFISLVLQRLQQEAAATGKQLGQEEALIESIRRYETRTGSKVLTEGKAAQEFKRETFGMDLGGSRPQEPAGITPASIAAMSDKEFIAFKEARINERLSQR